MDANPGAQISLRNRRYFNAIRIIDDISITVVHPFKLASYSEQGEGVHDILPGTRNADGRYVLRP